MDDLLVSVVVATRDRSARLARLLHALSAQTLQPAEIVVVDDGSRDDTPSLLASSPVRAVTGHGRGPGIARNLGWRAATGRLIAFTDDDCEPRPEWLGALVAAAATHHGAVVQGPVSPNPAERNRMGACSRTLEITGPSPHFETANVLYPRALLERLGGFDEQYAIAGEDTDLGWRAVATGAAHVFAPEALVYHAVHQKTRKQTLKDAWRASDCVATYKAYPHLRAHLQDGLYFHPSHPLFAQAVAAGMLGRRRPALRAFAAPYAAHLVKRCRSTGAPLTEAPFFALRDAVEITAVLHGAVKHRTFLF